MSSIDVSGLSSVYSDYLSTQAKDNQNEKIKNTASGDYTNASDEELMNACKKFESYFLEQVFKEMEKTIPKSDTTDNSTSNMVDYFKDSMVQELASESTETDSLGLSQMLFEQMKRNYNL